MNTVILGRTGISSPQNAFGALPIQRDDFDTAAALLRRAYDGGMTFFDTARAYSDSEEKIGLALADVRDKIHIATKTPDEMKRHLETSLRNLRTDYVDIYQFHCSAVCYHPGDGTGMYETMEDFVRQGMVRHIGITCHNLAVAEACVDSGLYATMQYPFSYLSTEREIALAARCRAQNVGFIAMKGMAGGLITDARAAYAFAAQYDNVLPIWGVQRAGELEQWLSFMQDEPAMTPDLRAQIETDRAALSGSFCRACGYCMPCPQGILINQCARMSLLLRRAPAKAWLSETWQAEMKKIETCLECGACAAKCPYKLDTPALLRANYDDYQRVLAGEAKV